MTNEKINTPSSSGKGFGGFGDLVSDVSKDIEQISRQSPPENKTISPPDQAPRQSKKASGKFYAGLIAAAIFIAWLSGVFNGKNHVTHREKDSHQSTFDFSTAKPVTNSEIVEQLARQSNFNLAGARKDGYTDQQIVEYLTSSQNKDAVEKKHGYKEFNGALDSPAVPNLNPTDHAPNGQPWPTNSGYLHGYKKSNTGGLSSLTIDNTSNDSNVYLKLFALDGSRPSAARHVFIKAGDKFTFSSVTSGNYDVRYRDLSTGALSKTEAFKLHEIYEDGGTRYSKMTMTLYKVRDGNMQMRGISESEF